MGRDLAAAIDRAAAALRGAGIERARAEARLLAARALGCGVEAIIVDPGRALSAEQSHNIEALAARRAGHEPMAYILGRREFHSLELAVTPAVLIPRPDSETLVDAVLAAIPDRARPVSLLDLGTGSGCLLLALLSGLPHASGVGLDRSAAALDVARANAQALGLGGRCRWVEGEWAAALPWAPFDIVVANPPYIPSADIELLTPEVAAHEPHGALDGGRDGLDAYRLIVPLLPLLLTKSGIAAVEVGAGQVTAVSDLMISSKLLNLHIFRDLAGIERVVLAYTNP